MKKAVSVLASFVAILWIVQAVNTLSGQQISHFGIIPRDFVGLRGVVLAPFIHHGFLHLALNTAPLAILGGLVMLRGAYSFYVISLEIVLMGGLLVWLLGRPAVHAGASGLIYGYFGFLVASGWYDRKPGSVLIALLVIFLYGGMVWGFLPVQAHVSWEAHIAGFAAGVLVSRFSSPAGNGS